MKEKEIIPFEKLMRRFKRKCDLNKIVDEARSRTYFIKPSARKRLKAIQRERKLRNANK